MKLELFQIDAFTNSPFNGNPAAVTFSDGLSSKQMQLIAREMNLSETAFISQSKKADYKLQWFTPTSEVKLCGHATIASLHFLRERNILKNRKLIRFDTLSGLLNCYRDRDNYYMQIPLPRLSEYKKSKKELGKVLGLKSIEKNIPWLIVNGEVCYLNVGTLNELKNIKPDYKALLNLSKLKKEFRVIVVCTLETIDKSSSAHSRCFVPYYGINEDPVTGSANGPLLLVLQKLGLIDQKTNKIRVTFEQGDFLGRKGRIGVTFSSQKKELYISGRAITIMKGILSF